MHDDIQRACEIIEQIEREQVEEFEIEKGHFKLSLSRAPEAAFEPAVAAGTVPTQPRPTQEAPPEAPPAAPSPRTPELTPITSPMVGMFYRSPSSDKPPFVNVGDVVEAGRPVCIIEAMKLMNLITASAHSRIAKILVENQSPVQAGQVLMLAEPL